MELIASIPLVGGLLAVLIPFIVVLGIVVAVHEYGHYIIGRWCGIHAEVFSVGYGRPIWSRYDKRGTKWQISWLPLGGYVKFLGDANASSFGDSDALDGMSQDERDRSFPGASVGRRAATVAAGPVFNFILSTFLFAGVIMWMGIAVEPATVAGMETPEIEQSPLEIGDQIIAVNGQDVTTMGEVSRVVLDMEGTGPIDLTVSRGDREIEFQVPYLFPPLVTDVRPLSPASTAGMKRGDFIMSLAGEDLVSFEDLKRIVLASNGKDLEMVVRRNGELRTLFVTPEVSDIPTAEGGFEKRVMIGVVGSLAINELRESPGPIQAFKFGGIAVYNTISTSLNAMKSLVTGALGLENLSGPVGIARVSGEQAAKSFIEYIEFMAIISTAIGMLNLFPIPILDGGHLVIFAYEAVVGRQPAEKILNFAMSVGFVLLMALMVFATYNDVMKI